MLHNASWNSLSNWTAIRSYLIEHCDSLHDCCLQGLLIALLICLAGSLPAAERVHSCLQVTLHQIQLRELATQLTEFFQVRLNKILIHFQPITCNAESRAASVSSNFQSLFHWPKISNRYYLSMRKQSRVTDLLSLFYVNVQCALGSPSWLYPSSPFNYLQKSSPPHFNVFHPKCLHFFQDLVRFGTLKPRYIKKGRGTLVGTNPEHKRDMVQLKTITVESIPIRTFRRISSNRYLQLTVVYT